MTFHCDIVRALPPRQDRFAARVAILIPAYNEGAHLADLVRQCVALEPAVVLVVNDASTDDTAAVLETVVGGYRGTQRWVRVSALHLAENAGKQGAVKRGLQWLAGQRLDAVALIDGDGQHDPRELPARTALLDRYDAVLGMRSRAQMPAQRRLSNRLVNWGFRLLSGIHFGDVQSGLRIYRADLARLLAEELPSRGGYGLEHASLTVLARHARDRRAPLHLAAAPISCAYGEAESSLGPRAVWQLAHQTLREAFRIRRLVAAPAC